MRNACVADHSFKTYVKSELPSHVNFLLTACYTVARLLELQLCPRRALSSDRRLLQHHYHICLERSLHRHTDRFLRGYILKLEQRSCSHGYGYCYERPIP